MHGTCVRICLSTIPEKIYLYKFNNRNTRKRYEIYSKLTIKIPKRCQWHRKDVKDVVLVSILLALIFHTFSGISFVDFEQADVEMFSGLYLQDKKHEHFI